MFYFYGGTHADTIDPVLQEFKAEVDRVKAGSVSPLELKHCQTRLKAQKRMSLQTIKARAMTAALNILYGLSPNAWKKYDTQIDAITLEDLQAHANHYFDDSKKVVFVVKPKPASL